MMNLTDIESSPSQSSYSSSQSLSSIAPAYTKSNQLIQYMITKRTRDDLDQIKEQLKSISVAKAKPIQIRVALLEGMKHELQTLIHNAKRSRNHRAMASQYNSLEDESAILVRLFEKVKSKVREYGAQYKNLIHRKLECLDLSRVQGLGIQMRNTKTLEILRKTEQLVPKMKEIAERMMNIKELKEVQLIELIGKLQSIKPISCQIRISLSPRYTKQKQTMKQMIQIEQQCEDKENHNGYLINR